MSDLTLCDAGTIFVCSVNFLPPFIGIGFITAYEIDTDERRTENRLEAELVYERRKENLDWFRKWHTRGGRKTDW